MATAPPARSGGTTTWDRFALAVVGTLVALIGTMVGAWALSTGRPLAAAVLAPLIPGLFLANIALVLKAPRAARFQKRGGVLAAGVMGLGLALVAATFRLSEGCFGVSAAPCAAVDGVPVLFISLLVGLAELWTGFQILYDWSGAAGRSGLRGALEGIVVAVQGIGLLLHLLAALGEFAVGAVIVVLVVLFLLSLAFGVPLWLVLIVLVLGIIVLGALIGFVIGVIEGPDGQDHGSGEGRTSAGPPNPGRGAVWGPPGPAVAPHPTFPPQPLPPLPQAVLLQPPALPPPPVAQPAPPPPGPPRFCSLCGSPHILVALPPHRRVHCQTCGRESLW